MQIVLGTLVLVAVTVSFCLGGDIHDAAAEGNVARVKELLTKDPACISSLNKHDDTPLHVAVGRSQLAVVKVLLENGAEVNARGCNGKTPLHYASERMTIQALLQYKADLGSREYALCQTPLEQAAERFTWLSQFPDEKEQATMWRTKIKILLDLGADYDIHTAIYLNDIARVRRLVSTDKTLVSQDHGAQMLPLRRAAQEGRTEICKFLLEHKADPDDIPGLCGLPVLCDAMKYPAIVRLLLDAGANPHVRVTYNGFITGLPVFADNATLLHFAALEGVVESAKPLLDKGVNVNGVDDTGLTPLHVAARVGHAAMVRFLLDRGADINANDCGQTPLAVADSLGPDKGAAEVLRQRGGME